MRTKRSVVFAATMSIVSAIWAAERNPWTHLNFDNDPEDFRFVIEILREQKHVKVAGTLCSSVVARINSRCSGGSSMIFSSALKAPIESI